jgi:hypothetical protein
VQVVLVAHMVVQAANSVVRLEQLKQVLPLAQGWPQAGTKVVHVPCRQVTPALVPSLMIDPSSVAVGAVAQPQAG